MSLLLDALKKAAKDKEARSASNTVVSDATSEDDIQNPGENNEEAELTLEDISATQPEQAVQKTVDEPPVRTKSDQSHAADHSYNHAPTQVSDEALEVLIYKTNHAHRRKRKLIWTSATVISAVVLISSGLYFFKQIQQGISMLELRHRVHMRAIESEPVKVKNLQLLASDGATSGSINTHKSIDTKIKTPTQAPPETKNSRHVATRKPHKAISEQGSEPKAISFQRTRKKDPVGALLTEAWNAYNAEDYKQARNLYGQVLAQEKNNRDALMGMGAVALKNNERDAALKYYGRMLQLDPRDPVANAAILNMNNKAEDDAQTESRLLYLIKLEPDAAHLYYALGNKYASQDKWPEAESAYFSAYEHDSNSADYAYNLAVSLERIGRSKQAVQYYEAALRLAKNNNVGFSIDVVKKRLSQIQP